MGRFGIVAVFCAAASLTGCAVQTVEPVVDLATVRIRVRIEVPNAASELRTSGLRNKTQGVLFGAAGGAVMCIGGGLELDTVAGGSGIGLLLGTLVSPICSGIGAVVSGVTTPSGSTTREDEALATARITSHLWPVPLADSLAEALQGQALVVRTAPTHELQLQLTGIRFKGMGSDPPLSLVVTSAWCLVDVASGDRWDLGMASATTERYRLQDWAAVSNHTLQEMRQSLADQLASQLLPRLYRNAENSQCSEAV